MKHRSQTTARRRDMLRAVMTGVAVAMTYTTALEPAAAGPRTSGDRRKARYQANSAEVRNFYRVNRYPAQ